MEQADNRSRARHALTGVWETTGRFGLHEAVIVVSAFLLYFFVRGAVTDRTAFALDNARYLIDVEKAMGLYHEKAMQSLVLVRSSRVMVRTSPATAGRTTRKYIRTARPA